MIMCRNNEYIKETILYLKRTGIAIDPFEALPKSKVGKIPLAFSHGYQLYSTKVLGKEVILALDAKGEHTPLQTEKARNAISSRLQCPVVFVFPELASYNIPRIVEKRIDFIIPGKQMFMPSMMIDLKEPKAINSDIKEKIHPLAQVLLLWQMEKGGLQGLTMADIVSKSGFSYATVNRAVRWLKENGLVSLSSDKEKKISFVSPGKTLWDKVQPLLVSPVERIVYTDEDVNGLLESGVNALSEYSMINRNAQDCFAIGKEDLKGKDLLTDKAFGKTRLEVWRYNPRLVAEDNAVDPLSLYLSLKNSEDERIQMELDTLIENIRWSEE